MIFDDFARALGQLWDPRFLRVLLFGLVLAVAALAGTTWLMLWLVSHFLPHTIDLPWIGSITWFGSALGWGMLVVMLVVSSFLMVPVTSAMTSLFLDQVADAVEARHYPALGPAPHLSLGTALLDGLGFLARMALANLAALVVYLVLPFTAPFVFLAVNGWLLGREYFQLTALRRLGSRGARAMARRHRGEIWLAGVLMTLPLSIPLVNLVIPVLGAATFTHLYHRLIADEVAAARSAARQ